MIISSGIQANVVEKQCAGQSLNQNNRSGAGAEFPSGITFSLLGAGLIAISYGLARFAFGLFVPPVQAELELTPYVVGIIGALPLLSFVLAGRRYGARYVLALVFTETESSK